jgi:hypothetical protein
MAATHWFKLDDAFRFATTHGLSEEADRIRLQPVHSTFRKPWVVKKGYFVALFRSKGLFDEFAAQYWPGHDSPRGAQTHASYLEQMQLNEKLLQGEPLGEDEPIEKDDAPDPALLDPAAFALEAQLRDFIVDNLAKIPIDGKRLSLRGKEHPTDVGPIDILACDDAGNFVVFELKLGRGPDRALGQLARYMGWVKHHLAGNRDVQGVVVAKSIDEKLRYAACVIPNVTLLEYDIDFRLRSVNGAPNSQPSKS